jgi:hypothetical protein
MAFDVSVEKIVERYPVAWSVLLSALYFYSGFSTEPLYPGMGRLGKVALHQHCFIYGHTLGT